MEEDEILPKALVSLATDDWLDIGCKSNLDIDPLSQPDILKKYGSLYDFIASINLNLQVQ